MDCEEDSISIYLTEDCKSDNRQQEKAPFNIPSFTGRWSKEEWALYLKFSLIELCKRKLNSKEAKNFSFFECRRSYKSFDRRFVQFLKSQGHIQYLSLKDEVKLIKRTKSKFNTLKRKHSKFSQKNRKKGSSSLDFVQLMYRQAKILLPEFNTELKDVLLQFELLKLNQKIQDRLTNTHDHRLRKKNLKVLSTNIKNEERQAAY